MEIIISCGGLGNQMFHYAFYLAKKRKNKSTLFCYPQKTMEHNGYELENVFGIRQNAGRFYVIAYIVWKLIVFRNKKYFSHIASFGIHIIKFLGIKIKIELELGTYNSDYLENEKGITVYYGYWQTEKYFATIKDSIYDAFSFNKQNLSEKSYSALQQIEKTNSVSIHIRRGDQVSNLSVGNISTKTYYQKALQYVDNHIESPTYFVFSDDIPWVKKNLQIPNPQYIDWNRKRDDWQDMLLMSKCKHNIIANSTFSWWGAWLNTNPGKKVISPNKFSNTSLLPDLIPAEWITFE